MIMIINYQFQSTFIKIIALQYVTNYLPRFMLSLRVRKYHFNFHLNNSNGCIVLCWSKNLMNIISIGNKFCFVKMFFELLYFKLAMTINYKFQSTFIQIPLPYSMWRIIYTTYYLFITNLEMLFLFPLNDSDRHKTFANIQFEQENARCI